MLDLYILNSCGYCKKVMQYLNDNNITYNIIDTDNKDNVLKLMTIGGKDQIPFLHDIDNDKKIYESDEIIKYLSNNIKK